MQYKKILENISGWLWTVDTSSKYIYSSQNVFDLLGYTEEEVIGKIPSDFMSEEESSRISNFFRDLIITCAPIKEFVREVIHKDGSIVILKTSAIPVYNEDGVWLGYEGIDQNITYEKNLEKELEVSYSKLHKLTENIPGAIYQFRLYPDGRMTFPYASKGSQSIWELTPQEVMNDAAIAFNRIHPDDAEIIATSIEDSAKTMKNWNLEYRLNLPKKGLRWIHGHAKPEKLEDGSILWHGYINDITEQVEYRETLKSQSILLEHRQKELETIINENPHPMILHKEGGKIIMLNNAWFKSSGFTIEDTPTINDWIELTRKDEEVKASLRKHIDSLYKITATIDEGEFTFVNKNKDIVSWQFSSSPLGLIDGKKTVVTSAMDITNLKKTERILVQQSKMAAMGEMLGNIAHQWRQPLSTISTASTGAKLQKEMDCLSDSELVSALTTINHSAQYLSTTIDDFRDFFNPNNNKIHKINIVSTLEKALKLVGPQFNAKDIEFIQDIESFDLLSIENELVQVLINLLNNAKDILLTKENLRKLIFINTYQKDNASYIEIKDNGGGIKDTIINRIFEPYFTTKHQSQGTGIGLYMSEEIVKNHLNGTLNVENTTYIYDDIEYTGALFTIKLNINR